MILLKEYVKMVLSELYSSSYKATGDAITKAVRDIVGNDVTGADCKGPSSKEGQHCRITIKDLHTKDIDLEALAKDSIEMAFGTPANVRNIGKVHSGKYDTYQVIDDDGNVHNIIFRGGLTGGQRGGGYAYEQVISNNLISAGVESSVGQDTTKSDVFVKTKSGTKVGIEVKGAGAKFGQPTLYYSYIDEKFGVPPSSRSVENSRLVVDVLNGAENLPLTNWMNSIKDAWDSIHPENEMSILSVQIQSEDWERMMQSRIKQSGPKVPIQIEQIVQYYRKKEANYIQIQGKGLYSFDDVLGIGAKSFIAAAASLDSFIKPEILKSGGNKVFRASITLNYASLANSNMDLANSDDVKKFAKAIKNS